jgi:SAM-dependent methyltransferase
VPLAYYSRAATQEFWSEHWGHQDVEQLVRIAAASPLTALIEDALPRAGPILEAGCGLGQYVILLRERGRAVSGVDWSLAALRRCRATAPAAPLAAMNLDRLAIKTATLAAYISLGVVEHDANGPHAIVAEAARVLAPGGILVLSVPYWNGVRRILGTYLARSSRRLRAAGGEFYQFAFARGEVRAFLEARGLTILSMHPYDPARIWRTLARRLSLTPDRPVKSLPAGPISAGRARPARTRRRARAVLKRILYTSPSLAMFGHMILAVAVKPAVVEK